MAAVNKDSYEENPRINLLRETNVPRVNQKDFVQVSEELEGRVTKKLSQEFSRTESRIPGAFSKRDELILNSLVRLQTGTAPETSRNDKKENQECNEDRSQNDPQIEVGTLVNRYITATCEKLDFWKFECDGMKRFETILDFWNKQSAAIFAQNGLVNDITEKCQ